MSSIFLSHNSKDKPFVRKLADSLRSEGHVVWIDEAEINIGDSLVEKIRDGLDKVDYVAAILSENSIASAWVQRELDISSNREIAEKRVILLPLMLQHVDLPGFLMGKKYGDFTTDENYEQSLKELLKVLGPVDKHLPIEPEDIEELKAQLQAAKDYAEAIARLQEHQNSSFSSTWTPALKAKVEEKNKKFPQHIVINDAYAFNAINDNVPVTLDYLLWAISKTMRNGAHPLDALMQMGNTYDKAEAMIEAYMAYLGNPKH
ncbi:toll/interleukin-1 receptor domain-containing protein [Klebsiella aerogenes]|uniref:Toll/interleukin-1 receptor domain-containing protein n=1 Tax=Klebsiella aerogenes TaxID=548 RepID=A0AAW9LM71_KLEAE|nr:toll/interleukin-1 receptor domain-containing protein [Klebsiella aerogenes]MEA8799200.1 toll/interleukin-1 receptor domain-containing protein [Klebsiella aerogenes]